MPQALLTHTGDYDERDDDRGDREQRYRVEPPEAPVVAVVDRADTPASGDRIGEIARATQRDDDRGRHEVVQLDDRSARAAHLVGVVMTEPPSRRERAHLIH